jgi:putative endonuclease
MIQYLGDWPSQSIRRNLYIGMTGNLERRLREHRAGRTRTTARMGPLAIVHTENFATIEEARKREIYLKTAAGRRYLKQQLGR